MDSVPHFRHDNDIISASRSSTTPAATTASSIIMSSPQKSKTNKAIKSLKSTASITLDTFSSRMADLEADFRCEMKKIKAEQRALSQTNTMAFRELRARMIDQEIAHKDEMEAKINQELRLQDLISSTDIVANRVTDLERSTLARFQTLRGDLSATFRVLDDHLCEVEAELAEQRVEHSDLRRVLKSLLKRMEEVELAPEDKNSCIATQVMAGSSLEE